MKLLLVDVDEEADRALDDRALRQEHDSDDQLAVMSVSVVDTP